MAGTRAQDEVRAVFDQLLEAQNAGDAERVRSLLSERPGAVHIGTDAEEWWTRKQVADAVAAVGGTDDAWAEGRGRFTRAGGGERPVRMSGVLVREEGQWKVVQSHASIGVPNADIFG